MRNAANKRKFALAYLTNGNNATRAYQCVHPDASNKAAQIGGFRYIRDPDIRSFIADAIESNLDHMDAVFKHQLITLLERRAFFDITEIIGLDGKIKVTEEEVRAQGLDSIVDEVKVRHNPDGTTTTEIKFVNRSQAIDSLIKYLDLFEENKPAENEGATKIVVLPQTMTIEEWNEKYAPKDWIPL